MSEFPAVDFEALAKKYVTEKNDAQFRADQLENIANSLKARLDHTEELLSEEHRKNSELAAQVSQTFDQAPASEASTAVIPGETV
jgi:hypothetical protein